VLTVDHGLQPQSGVHAKQVVKWARELGLEAVVLTVKGETPVSNIEDAAREARYRLMGEWCAKHSTLVLLLAHTREDQAETFLLRLARGSGVDGLSAMRPRSNFPFGPGPVLLRPLLGFARADLRRYLSARGASWIEDPMNADERYDRSYLRHRVWPVLVDRGRLDQVLMNLSVNAKDAMPDGGKLSIALTNENLPKSGSHEAGDYVALKISDTGCGIAADTIGRIFDPFFTTKAPGKGTGLGLATCYAILRQAGGDISVDSTPGQGTCFTLLLPRAEGRAAGGPSAM
jgi:tRNA(Ile)-lysidine synthetase-like protein